MTLLGFKTVRQGTRAAVWSRSGKVKVVDGPKRLMLCLQRCEHISQYYADQSEYLEVRKRTGPVVILPGPCFTWLDPLEDESIYVRKAIQIDASQALIVYRSINSGQAEQAAGSKSASGPAAVLDGVAMGHVDRRIVRGPARFIPQADEWVHEFSWSGVPRDGSKTTYQPNANKFTKLGVIPMSSYHNVSEVRTNDDTLITVKLMIFYELNDIEKMLAATNDPIADFINAASADVIAFCAKLNYEAFLTLTGKLNELETFGQLVHRASSIGYAISKVVFRGFQAGDKLQAMHDGAIQERTRLRLLEETQEQAQRAEDLRLEGEQRRAAKQAELETEQQRLKADLSLSAQQAAIAEQRLLNEAKLEREHAAHEAELQREAAAAEAKLEQKAKLLELERQRDEEQLRMMREMKGLGVDLTKVLISQHEQTDHVLKIDTGNAGNPFSKGGEGAPSKGLLSALQLNL